MEYVKKSSSPSFSPLLLSVLEVARTLEWVMDVSDAGTTMREYQLLPGFDGLPGAMWIQVGHQSEVLIVDEEV